MARGRGWWKAACSITHLLHCSFCTLHSALCIPPLPSEPHCAMLAMPWCRMPRRLPACSPSGSATPSNKWCRKSSRASWQGLAMRSQRGCLPLTPQRTLRHGLSCRVWACRQVPLACACVRATNLLTSTLCRVLGATAAVVAIEGCLCAAAALACLSSRGMRCLPSCSLAFPAILLPYTSPFLPTCSSPHPAARCERHPSLHPLPSPAAPLSPLSAFPPLAPSPRSAA